jgi:hypothetical protein
MSLISGFLCKTLVVFVLLCGTLVFYYMYETVQNTSFNIASRHMSAVHDYACNIKTSERVYVVVRDPGNVVNATYIGDIIVGNLHGISTVASSSYSFVTSNQYFQYTSRMPEEDSNGLYFDVCVSAEPSPDELSRHVIAICYAVIFALVCLIVFLALFTKCLCAGMCRTGQYEEIN